MLKDEFLPPKKLPLAIIMKLYFGKDNKIKVADIKKSPSTNTETSFNCEKKLQQKNTKEILVIVRMIEITDLIDLFIIDVKFICKQWPIPAAASK